MSARLLAPAELAAACPPRPSPAPALQHFCANIGQVNFRDKKKSKLGDKRTREAIAAGVCHNPDVPLGCAVGNAGGPGRCRHSTATDDACWRQLPGCTTSVSALLSPAVARRSPRLRPHRRSRAPCPAPSPAPLQLAGVCGQWGSGQSGAEIHRGNGVGRLRVHQNRRRAVPHAPPAGGEAWGRRAAEDGATAGLGGCLPLYAAGKPGLSCSAPSASVSQPCLSVHVAPPQVSQELVWRQAGSFKPCEGAKGDCVAWHKVGPAELRCGGSKSSCATLTRSARGRGPQSDACAGELRHPRAAPSPSAPLCAAQVPTGQPIEFVCKEREPSAVS